MVDQFKLSETKLRNLSKDLAISLGFELAAALVNRIAVDEGGTRSSIRVEIENDEVVIVANENAKYLEFGTPPHIIRPKNAKALRFEVGRKARLNLGKSAKDANIVFAKKVNHPGTRPQPFIRPTIRDDLSHLMIKAINTISE